MSDIKTMRYFTKPSNFAWHDLGDLNIGRTTLGLDMPVLVYRLFQYTLKDVLAREFSEEYAGDLFRAAGHLAGTHFARQMLDLHESFDQFVSQLTRALNDLRVGIMRVESADLENLTFTLTISEDLDCSGLPITDETVCDYDEGFIAGILEAYSGKNFNVKEIDCWATGSRTCRFAVKAK